MSDTRDAVVDYISSRFAPEDDLLKKILKEQKQGGGPMMNIGPDQGKFLYLLVKLLKPKNILEVGSYYGYSSVWLARALCHSEGAQRPSGSSPIPKLHCVEVSQNYCNNIRAKLEEAGLAECTEVHQGSGLDLMNQFVKDKKVFEIIFIDADKANYSNYLDLAEKLLPSGGLLLVDNCLWNGEVLDTNTTSAQTRSIQGFNDKLAALKSFESLIITIQDGLAFAVKK